MGDGTVIHAIDLFAKTLDEMMGECGLDGRECTKEQLKAIIAECFALQPGCYDEFVLWVIYGDDTRAKTMAIIRGGHLWKSRRR